MPSSHLSDLLPIQRVEGNPNAYQVFGLANGERDDAKIAAAMQQVYSSLKSSKTTADPSVWKQAVKLAEAARKLLEDPEQRRALDEKLGLGIAKTHATSPEPADDDPLAALLPKSKPLDPSATANSANDSIPGSAAAILGVPPGIAPSAATILGTPPLGSASPLGTPPTHIPGTPVPSAAAVGTPTASQPGPAAVTAAGENTPISWAPPKPQKKRRQKNTGLFVFAVFVVVMLAAIVGLLKFLTDGGQIALQPNGGRSNDGVIVADPMSAPDRSRVGDEVGDGVLGNIAASGIAPSLRGPNNEPRTDRGSGIGSVAPTIDPTIDPMPPRDTFVSEQPTGPQPTPMDPTPMDPTPAPGPDTMREPTAAMVTANQSEIEAVEQLIRSANWNEMKTAAEALLKRSLTAEQSKRASALYDISDLATFYRGAISRGLATLSTGSTFDYEGIPVIVVEVTPETLVIQFNKKSRSFTLQDMPPRLAETITSFSLSSDRPDAVAGQALYRLIHTKTRSEYRDDSFEQLVSVEGQLDQVDTVMLQQVAKEILSQ